MHQVLFFSNKPQISKLLESSFCIFLSRHPPLPPSAFCSYLFHYLSVGTPKNPLENTVSTWKASNLALYLKFSSNVHFKYLKTKLNCFGNRRSPTTRIYCLYVSSWKLLLPTTVLLRWYCLYTNTARYNSSCSRAT